jgi:hypothetical protein
MQVQYLGAVRGEDAVRRGLGGESAGGRWCSGRVEVRTRSDVLARDGEASSYTVGAAMPG